MFDEIRVIQSTETSVKKLVLTKPDAVAETVLYRYPTYEDRTVICCSSQSGCPVGCRFCGAGDFFVRSFTTDEIVAQVDAAIAESATNATDMARLQIMFMSMGEPLLNRNGMVGALRQLHTKYPNAALLISTIGPDIDWSWVIEISKEIPTIGLQFSVHQPNDAARDVLIPFRRKLALDQIAETGRNWWLATGRKPFFNYCAGDENTSDDDALSLCDLFDPQVWECTISVICERNEGLPARNAHQEELARDFSAKMLNHGFNVRVFDPAGQDDIGGGCGQLWFVQDWMQKNPDKARPSVGCGMPKVHVPAAREAGQAAQPVAHVDGRSYRKKPVVVKAVQWTGENLREVIAFTDGPPETKSHHAGMMWEQYEDLVRKNGLKIYTLEGKMDASPGDWIIKGVKGEFYPCKPDIFAATYDPANQPTAPVVPAEGLDDAHRYALHLATALRERLFPDNTCWRPFDDLLGLLTQIDNMTTAIAPPVVARVIAEKAYLAGFNAAGEGYNGEWPFHDKGVSPDTDEGWLIGRDMALAALLPAGEGE